MAHVPALVRNPGLLQPAAEPISVAAAAAEESDDRRIGAGLERRRDCGALACRQKRKGADGEPYVNHLLEVARLVAEATKGEDVALVIAALLHDAIEDQQIPPATIAERFGDDVAALVQEVSDDKSLESSERKRRQVEEAPKKSARAKILKLADKISNVTSIGDDPPADWPRSVSVTTPNGIATWWRG